jgi:Uma2 family endonuclease
VSVKQQKTALELRDAVVAEPRRFTYHQLVAELPETNRPCELWDGELRMSPAPSFQHQKIAFRFGRFLDDWINGRDLGEVALAPVDMVLSPHRVLQPDIVFVARDRLNIVEGAIQGAADLVAEVVSLGGRTRDRIQKRDLYEQHGVKEYWIIDPEARTVEVLFLEPTGYRLAGIARGSETARSMLLDGFTVKLDGLFAGIKGGV